MNGGLVDDYLSQLLGAVSSNEPIPLEPLAAKQSLVTGVAPVVSAPATEDISEAEFEALLDALHGGKAPGTQVPVTAPAPSTPQTSVTAPAPTAQAARHAKEAEPWQGQERRSDARRSTRWLRLQVHEQGYAVELLKVQEVLLPVSVLAMRDTDPAILGVMNLRGIVVPVLDLGVWLGLEEVTNSAQTRYVVLEQNGDCVALKVSAVLDVHAIADGRVEPAEHTLAPTGAGMIHGVTRLNSLPVILLDAVGLLR